MERNPIPVRLPYYIQALKDGDKVINWSGVEVSKAQLLTALGALTAQQVSDLGINVSGDGSGGGGTLSQSGILSALGMLTSAQITSLGIVGGTDTIVQNLEPLYLISANQPSPPVSATYRTGVAFNVMPSTWSSTAPSNVAAGQSVWVSFAIALSSEVIRFTSVLKLDGRVLTDAQVRAKVESAADSNVFTDALKSKLDAVNGFKDVSISGTTVTLTRMDDTIETFEVPRGLQGLTGQIGLTGAPGADGENAVANQTLFSDASISNNIITLTRLNGEEVELTVVGGEAVNKSTITLTAASIYMGGDYQENGWSVGAGTNPLLYKKGGNLSIIPAPSNLIAIAGTPTIITIWLPTGAKPIGSMNLNDIILTSPTKTVRTETTGWGMRSADLYAFSTTIELEDGEDYEIKLQHTDGTYLLGKEDGTPAPALTDGQLHDLAQIPSLENKTSELTVETVRTFSDTTELTISGPQISALTDPSALVYDATYDPATTATAFTYIKIPTSANIHDYRLLIEHDSDIDDAVISGSSLIRVHQDDDFSYYTRHRGSDQIETQFQAGETIKGQKATSTVSGTTFHGKVIGLETPIRVSALPATAKEGAERYLEADVVIGAARVDVDLVAGHFGTNSRGFHALSGRAIGSLDGVAGSTITAVNGILGFRSTNASNGFIIVDVVVGHSLPVVAFVDNIRHPLTAQASGGIFNPSDFFFEDGQTYKVNVEFSDGTVAFGEPAERILAGKYEYKNGAWIKVPIFTRELRTKLLALALDKQLTTAQTALLLKLMDSESFTATLKNNLERLNNNQRVLFGDKDEVDAVHNSILIDLVNQFLYFPVNSKTDFTNSVLTTLKRVYRNVVGVSAVAGIGANAEYVKNGDYGSEAILDPNFKAFLETSLAGAIHGLVEVKTGTDAATNLRIDDVDYPLTVFVTNRAQTWGEGNADVYQTDGPIPVLNDGSKHEIRIDKANGQLFSSPVTTWGKKVSSGLRKVDVLSEDVVLGEQVIGRDNAIYKGEGSDIVVNSAIRQLVDAMRDDATAYRGFSTTGSYFGATAGGGAVTLRHTDGREIKLLNFGQAGAGSNLFAQLDTTSSLLGNIINFVFPSGNSYNLGVFNKTHATVTWQGGITNYATSLEVDFLDDFETSPSVTIQGANGWTVVGETTNVLVWAKKSNPFSDAQVAKLAGLNNQVAPVPQTDLVNVSEETVAKVGSKLIGLENTANVTENQLAGTQILSDIFNTTHIATLGITTIRAMARKATGETAFVDGVSKVIKWLGSDGARLSSMDIDASSWVTNIADIEIEGDEILIIDSHQGVFSGGNVVEAATQKCVRARISTKTRINTDQLTTEILNQAGVTNASGVTVVTEGDGVQFILITSGNRGNIRIKKFFFIGGVYQPSGDIILGSIGALELTHLSLYNKTNSIIFASSDFGRHLYGINAFNAAGDSPFRNGLGFSLDLPSLGSGIGGFFVDRTNNHTIVGTTPRFEVLGFDSATVSRTVPGPSILKSFGMNALRGLLSIPADIAARVLVTNQISLRLSNLLFQTGGVSATIKACYVGLRAGIVARINTIVFDTEKLWFFYYKQAESGHQVVAQVEHIKNEIPGFATEEIGATSKNFTTAPSNVRERGFGNIAPAGSFIGLYEFHEILSGVTQNSKIVCWFKSDIGAVGSIQIIDLDSTDTPEPFTFTSVTRTGQSPFVDSGHEYVIQTNNVERFLKIHSRYAIIVRDKQGALLLGSGDAGTWEEIPRTDKNAGTVKLTPGLVFSNDPALYQGWSKSAGTNAFYVKGGAIEGTIPARLLSVYSEPGDVRVWVADEALGNAKDVAAVTINGITLYNPTKVRTATTAAWGQVNSLIFTFPSDIIIEAGKTYQIKIQLADGTFLLGDLGNQEYRSPLSPSQFRDAHSIHVGGSDVLSDEGIQTADRDIAVPNDGSEIEHVLKFDTTLPGYNVLRDSSLYNAATGEFTIKAYTTFIFCISLDIRTLGSLSNATRQQASVFLQLVNKYRHGASLYLKNANFSEETYHNIQGVLGLTGTVITKADPIKLKVVLKISNQDGSSNDARVLGAHMHALEQFIFIPRLYAPEVK